MCVCVCERENEREREGRDGLLDYFSVTPLSYLAVAANLTWRQSHVGSLCTSEEQKRPGYWRVL